MGAHPGPCPFSVDQWGFLGWNSAPELTPALQVAFIHSSIHPAHVRVPTAFRDCLDASLANIFPLHRPKVEGVGRGTISHQHALPNLHSLAGSHPSRPMVSRKGRAGCLVESRAESETDSHRAWLWAHTRTPTLSPGCQPHPFHELLGVIS